MVEQLPDTWDGAVRWFLGGTVVFALGFEGVSVALSGKFLLSGLSFLIAMGLLALMVYWPPGGSLILIMVAAALLSVLGTLEACKRLQLAGGRRMLIAGVVLLVVAIMAASVGGAIHFVGLTAQSAQTKEAEGEKAPRPANSQTEIRYIENVRIGFSPNGPAAVVLTGIPTKTLQGQKLSLFIAEATMAVLPGAGWQKPSDRLPVGEIVDPVKGVAIVKTIASREQNQDEKKDLFLWGVPGIRVIGGHAGGEPTPIRASLIIIGSNGDEQIYYFMLIRVLRNAEQPFLIIPEEDLSWASEWKAKGY